MKNLLYRQSILAIEALAIAQFMHTDPTGRQFLIDNGKEPYPLILIEKVEQDLKVIIQSIKDNLEAPDICFPSISDRFDTQYTEN